MDSPVYLIYHDPSDLGSLTLIRIIPKARTLSLAIGRIHPIVKDREGSGRGLQKNCQRAFPLVLGGLWWVDQKKENNMGDNFAVCLINFSQTFDYYGPKRHANFNNGDGTRRSCSFSYILGDFCRDWPFFSLSSAANYEAEFSNSWTYKSVVLSRKDAGFTSLKGNSKQKFYKETYGDSAILYRLVKGFSHPFIVLTLCILSSQNKLCGIGSVLYLFWKMLRFVVIMRW